MSNAPDMSAFQTKAELQALLGGGGLAPRRRYGQNFLIDRNLMSILIGAAEITRRDSVLEVGCGTGSLTGCLAAAAGRVLAVDIDPNVMSLARTRVTDPRVHWLQLDALANKSTLAPEMVKAIEASLDAHPRLLLVANLPYDIATPLVVNLMLSALAIKRYCFTVQAEVGDRFLAEPGTAAYGPVSVIAQTLTTGRKIRKVPAQAFWPAPKVSSVMIQLEAREQPPTAAPVDFAAFVRTFFGFRRKTLEHIAARVGAPAAVMDAARELGIPGMSRPEEIGVEGWIALHRASADAT